MRKEICAIAAEPDGLQNLLSATNILILEHFSEIKSWQIWIPYVPLHIPLFLQSTFSSSILDGTGTTHKQLTLYQGFAFLPIAKTLLHVGSKEP